MLGNVKEDFEELKTITARGFWSAKIVCRSYLENREAEIEENGRDDWIRTSDLTHPKGARYQASLRPDEKRPPNTV